MESQEPYKTKHSIPHAVGEHRTGVQNAVIKALHVRATHAKLLLLTMICLKLELRIIILDR